MKRNLKTQLLSRVMALLFLLTGCGDSKNTKDVLEEECSLVYNQDDSFSGSITTKNMECIKIVKFEQNGVTNERLMIVRETEYINPAYDCKIEYKDFESGENLIVYDVCFLLHPKVKYYLGENINILEVEPILPLLYDAGIYKDAYEANEVLAFYKGLTENTLNSQEDESVKYSDAISLITIKYMANGEDVSNVPEDKIFVDTEIPTISNAIPVRKGYTFVGWSTNPNALEADDKYSAGKMYFGSNIVLYAVWEELEISQELPDININLEEDKHFAITPKIGR